MSDLAAVAVAVAIALGAWVSAPVAPVITAAAVVAALVALAVQCPVPLGLAGFLVAACLSGRAWAGLEPEPPAPVRGVATAVSDAVEVPGGVRVDVRVGGRRVRASSADDEVSSVLRRVEAGDRIRIVGRRRPLASDVRRWLAPRHLAGRCTVEHAVAVDGGTPLARVANGVRHALLRGTASMPPNRRALFAGVVLGDDRDQDAAEVEDFRASGLTHLLAVSGQNVAFVLALVTPGLRRLGLTGRLLAVAGVLVVFGTVTRWEPSVVRAVAMAGVTTVAATLGRPVSPVRVLALASGGVVLIDPLLVHSVGFALSVGACAGIALLTPVLDRHLPSAVAVTVAAQAGVLPLLIATFGSVPLVSLPANVVAEPAAGPLMMWGVAGGLVAGVVGGPVAGLVHVPTRILLAWLSGVARIAAGLPVGELTTTRAVIGGAAIGASLLTVRGLRRRPVLAVAAALAAIALLPMVWTPAAHGARLATGGDDRLWVAGHHVVVVTDGRAPPGRLLDAVRRRGIRRIDVLVATNGSKAAARGLIPTLSRLAPALVVAPDHHQIAGAVGVGRPIVVTAGRLRIAIEPVEPDGKRLTARIGSDRAARARSP